MTLEIFVMSGQIPVVSEWLEMLLIGIDMHALTSFIILLGMLLGPALFYVSNDFIMVSISLGVVGCVINVCGLLFFR